MLVSVVPLRGQHALNRKDGLPSTVRAAVGNPAWLPRTYSLQDDVRSASLPPWGVGVAGGEGERTCWGT